jgi:hypothetical protein
MQPLVKHKNNNKQKWENHIDYRKVKTVALLTKVGQNIFMFFDLVVYQNGSMPLFW